jgi:hypothetical protein
MPTFVGGFLRRGRRWPHPQQTPRRVIRKPTRIGRDVPQPRRRERCRRAGSDPQDRVQQHKHRDQHRDIDRRERPPERAPRRHIATQRRQSRTTLASRHPHGCDRDVNAPAVRPSAVMLQLPSDARRRPPVRGRRARLTRFGEHVCLPAVRFASPQCAGREAVEAPSVCRLLASIRAEAETGVIELIVPALKEFREPAAAAPRRTRFRVATGISAPVPTVSERRIPGLSPNCLAALHVNEGVASSLDHAAPLAEQPLFVAQRAHSRLDRGFCLRARSRTGRKSSIELSSAEAGWCEPVRRRPLSTVATCLLAANCKRSGCLQQCAKLARPAAF